MKIWAPDGGRVVELTQAQVVGDVSSAKSWAQAAAAGFPLPSDVNRFLSAGEPVAEETLRVLADAVARWHPQQQCSAPMRSRKEVPLPQRVPVDWTAEDPQIADAAMRAVQLYADLGCGRLCVDPQIGPDDFRKLEISGDGWCLEAFPSRVLGPHVQVRTYDRRNEPIIESLSPMRGPAGGLAGPPTRYSGRTPTTRTPVTELSGSRSGFTLGIA